MNAVIRRSAQPIVSRLAAGSRKPAGPLHRGARGRSARRGAAVVELAVVTPLLLLMMFGIMEFGLTLMHRESLTNACREACRVRVLKGATDTDAKSRFTSAMSGTGLTVSASQISITPATQTNGDVIYTVTATVPRSSLSVFGLTTTVQRFMQMFKSSASLKTSSNVVVTCSMRQES